MPALLLALALTAAPLDLHVAPSGRDTWSGRLAAPNAAGTDGPFATLEHARDAVRASRAGGLALPVTVTIHGGTWRLAESLRFTPADSGNETCPITWRAAAGEKAVITGSRPVNGWQPDAGGVFVADLAAQGIDDPRFRELFDRGERQPLARFPDLDAAHPVTGGLLYVEDTAPQGKNSFFYKPGSIPFEQWGDFPQAEVNLHPYNCWDHNILRITSVDREASLVKLRYSVAGQIFVGNRYFVQNVRGALDAPGEWFSD
ncbi:MAG: hypothetical protein HYU66_24605 [Armatimonadetes bacterium]|nr:hypothetical protein [Armatimonadota bacterium]